MANPSIFTLMPVQPSVDLAAESIISAHLDVEQAIAATPTGPIRELLTSVNLQLQVALNATKGIHDGEAEIIKLNALLAGEPS